MRLAPRDLGLVGVCLVGVVAWGACSADSEGEGFENSGTGGEPGAGGAGTSASGGEGPGDFTTSASGSGAGGPNCDSDPNDDEDADGFTEMQGDCNACDANANPGAIEVIVTGGGGGAGGAGGGAAEPADEDCDSMVDEVEPTCDSGLAVDDPDPLNAAKAIDICHDAAGNSWGVVTAAYVTANGTPSAASTKVGILENFGPNVNVQLGERMFALSAGNARIPGQVGECGHQSCSVGPGTPPPGFPAAVPGCSGGSNINDDAALELRLRAPTNATGYSFLFKFYSFEFPEYVCTTYNDQFIAWVDPPPMAAINNNIIFDSQNNPVSVNIAFFDVCDPNGIGSYALVCGGCKAPPNPYCPSGTAELAGTGFDIWGDGGGTSWLQTTAPVTGGEELTVRFAIWDVGDTALDSTAVVDKFEWIANGATVNVGTDPIPDPK
jgi:hypothetical protein